MPIFSGRFQKGGRGATYTVTSSSGADIQAAINALTSGRTRKETVKCVGNFSITEPLLIPNYTSLDLVEARLVLANSVNDNMIENATPSSLNTQIDIYGGIIDGNKSNNTSGNSIYFENVTNSNIRDIYFTDSPRYTIELMQSVSGANADISISRNTISDSGYRSLTIRGDRIDVSHNKILVPDNPGGEEAHFIWLSSSRHCVISKNLCYSSPYRGIALSYGTTDCVVSGNIINTVGQHGILVDTSNAAGNLRNIIKGNRIQQSSEATGDGIVVGSGDTIVEGNIISLMGRFGIHVYANDGDISNVNILDNISFNNMQVSLVTGAGIFLQNDGGGLYEINDVIVSGNRVYDSQGVQTQDYGVRWAFAGVNRINRISCYNNNFVGNKTGGILNGGGLNHIIRNNQGHVTENSGTSAGTGAQQTIAHGLNFTPTRQQIALTSGSATALPFHSAGPDATNIYVTAALNQPWYWATVG